MALSLQKGQRISLEKNGSALQNICIGVNWGAIEKKGFFGGKKKEAVDLDASVGLFSKDGQIVDVVYFGNLRSKCGGVAHSGDDQTGDLDGDDGLDNEVVLVDLGSVNADASQVVFVLNSFRGHDFKDIPFARIRIYEGTPTRVDEIHATFDIANDEKFAGAVSMVMGKIYKHNDGWKFSAIGDPTRDKKLEQTLQTVAQNYL